MSPVARTIVTGDAVGSGSGGHVGGENVVGVAVEVLPGPVARGRAEIGVPGGDLDIAQVNPGIQHGCHGRCGRVIRTPACQARWRRRRVATCRSIRVSRLLSRIGPLARPAMARSMARPAAGQRHQDDLGALAAHARDAVAVFLARVGDAGARGFEGPQAQWPEHGHQREVVFIRRGTEGPAAGPRWGGERGRAAFPGCPPETQD